MKEVRRPDDAEDDVYYAADNGEFQPLSSKVARKLSKEIEIAIHANAHYEHDYQQVSDTSSMLSSECILSDVVAGIEGGEVLRERTIASYTLYRDHEKIDQVQTIVLAERLYAQRTDLVMASEHVGELSESYVRGHCEDRYIIERSIDGNYCGYVEQLDPTRADGVRRRRRMTLYDAAELVRQIDETMIV